MANALNRTTYEYRTSVHEGYLDPSEWIINPTQQEIADGANQRAALLEAQRLADAPYMHKSKEQIMTELWATVVLYPEDIYETRFVMSGDPPIIVMDVSGNPMTEQVIIREADTQQEIEEKLARQERFRVGMREMPFWHLRIDNGDWTLAREDAQAVLDAGIITQEDYDIVDSVLPLERPAS